MSDQSPKNNLINIELIPKDSLQKLVDPTFQSIGTALGDVLDGIFNLTLGKLRKYNIVQDSDLTNFTDKVNSKSGDIPNEYRDQTKMGLVLKALDSSPYQLNEEVMRELFANLIASTDEKLSKILNKPLLTSSTITFGEVLAEW